MFSIEECRKHIEDSEKYSDEEIVKIRDNLQGLAELAFDVYFREKAVEKTDGSTITRERSGV